MNITDAFINQFTGNASTVANGRKLAEKNSYVALYKSSDDTLIFGECKGSGKNPYRCSVDFVDPAQPIPRCSCPSRQIPCKHVAGLLFCHTQGKAFAVQDIPDDVAQKRGKIQQREEKKAKSAETREEKPKELTKARATAAIKKCSAQLEGIALAQKILHNIVLAGLGSLDRKNERMYLEQIKELGNYYISGIQAALTDLVNAGAQSQREQSYTDATQAINYTYALLKRSRAYTQDKIADYEAFPDTPDKAKEVRLHSSIEERMGYAWKLTELRDEGLFVEQAQLLQVGFDCYEDKAKRQWVDEGIWVSLTNGEVYLTQNFRPFKAAKYVHAQDSFFGVMDIPELYIYPGDKNPRVRWEKAEMRPAGAQDLQQAKAAGAAEYAPVIKAVKAQIKNPLSDKEPVYALRVEKLMQDENGSFVIADAAGTNMTLKLEKFGFLLRRIAKEQAEGQTLICRFEQDLEADMLYGKPVAMVTDDAVIRFTY